MSNQKLQLKNRAPTGLEPNFISTRHRDSIDLFDPDAPRLGRRESEPHSIEITYLYNTLKTNFPNSRVMWDLHHYFELKHKKQDIQYDISFFKGFKLNETLSSYESKNFDNRIPDLAINILSKSTWRADLLDHVYVSKDLKIPVYVVFPSYHVTTEPFKPPFLRVYILQENGCYLEKELREETFIENSNRRIIQKNTEAIIEVGDLLPFRFGLVKRKQEHFGGLPLYRVVLIKPDSLDILLTFSEKETNRADIAVKKLEEKDKEIEEKDKEIKLLKEKIKKLNY